MVENVKSGEAHYKKLAAEKNTWKKAKLDSGSTSVAYKNALKIDSLENRIVQLSEELCQARMSQDMQLSWISRVPSHASSVTMDRDDVTNMEDSISGASNMDSMRVNKAVTNYEGVIKIPSLFHPFPLKQVA